MEKLAASRNIPTHNPQATSAVDAYEISAIVTNADLRHLHASAFAEAVKSKAALESIQQRELWPSLDPFVKQMLRIKQAKGALPSQRKECSQWLAMYHACRKMLYLRPGAVLDEAVAPLEGEAEEGAKLSVLNAPS